MEGFLARYLTSEQRVVLRQFVSFSTVGFIGFFFDTATVYGTKTWVGLYAAGLLGGCPNLQLLLNAVHFSPSGRRFGSYYGYKG